MTPEFVLVLKGRVSVCVCAPVNEEPASERNHDGILGVVTLVPEDQAWPEFNTLIKHRRGLMTERAGTLSLCYGA